MPSPAMTSSRPGPDRARALTGPVAGLSRTSLRLGPRVGEQSGHRHGGFDAGGERGAAGIEVERGDRHRAGGGQGVAGHQGDHGLARAAGAAEHGDPARAGQRHPGPVPVQRFPVPLAGSLAAGDHLDPAPPARVARAAGAAQGPLDGGYRLVAVEVDEQGRHLGRHRPARRRGGGRRGGGGLRRGGGRRGGGRRPAMGPEPQPGRGRRGVRVRKGLELEYDAGFRSRACLGDRPCFRSRACLGGRGGLGDWGGPCLGDWGGPCLGDWGGPCLGDWCGLRLGDWCGLRLGEGLGLGEGLVLGEGAHFGEGTHLGERADLGERCDLGERARAGLRPRRRGEGRGAGAAEVAGVRFGVVGDLERPGILPPLGRRNDPRGPLHHAGPRFVGRGQPPLVRLRPALPRARGPDPPRLGPGGGALRHRERLRRRRGG